ncbi:MAG: diguanylate cyclase, partial [Chloroflexi bacterium]|nr:diguanylate cyclase [Chloroflexota bacterium]
SDPIVLLRLGLRFDGPPDEAALARARSAVAHILNANLRAVDIPGHYQDDYLIILPNTSEAGGRIIAGRLTQAVQARRAAGDDGNSALAIFMGMAAHPGGREADADALVSQSSAALAEARRRRANSVVGFGELSGG